MMLLYVGGLVLAILLFWEIIRWARSRYWPLLPALGLLLVAILIGILAPDVYRARRTLANELAWGIYLAALGGCFWIVYLERQWLRWPPSPMMLLSALLLVYLPINPRRLPLVMVCAALGVYWVVVRWKHPDAETSPTELPSARHMPSWQKYALAVALVIVLMILLSYTLWLIGRYL